MARPEGDMGTSKERRRVGSTLREAKTQKLVLTVLAVLAVSPIILLSLNTVPEDNYRGGEMYSTPKLRQAYEVVNAFEYPMNAGMVAEPCAPGKPLLNVILSGVDPPPELHKLSDARKAEYQDAVLRTMRNPEVKRLHIMAERDLMPGWIAELESRDPISYRTKVFLGRTRVGRLSFSYAIRYANEELKSGEVVLLTNADLAVEGGFGCENLSEEKLFQNTVLIPQRLEDDMCDRHLAKTCDARNFVGKVSLPSCFDSYVFRAPLKPEEITEERFGLLIGGEWQAENSFIKELRGIGVSVYSPPGGLLRLVHKVSGFLHRPPLVKTQLGRRLTTLFFVFVLPSPPEQHCSQERPNQHASQEMVRGKRREASDDRVCYEPFCGRTCMRNTIPFPDILTNICRDLDLCKEYAEKMRSMRSMANPAKELMTEHAEFCDYDPVVVMQVRTKE